MGKLKDLWAQLKDCKPEDRALIQKKINSIEEWMIKNKLTNDKGELIISELTDWNKNTKKTYRFESSRMGTFGQPVGAYVGRDRCGACKWNNHTWCDKGKTKKCVANV